MLTVKHKLVRWSLAGITFVAVLSQAGCSRVGHWLGMSKTPATPVATQGTTSLPEVPKPDTFADTPLPASSAYPDDSLFADASEAPSPAVNVFGELDGIERPIPASNTTAGFQQQTFLTEGADADIAVDASGKRLVFTSTRHGEHPKIYIQKSDGVSVTQLTSDASDDAHPVFSPDGKHIAFASTRSGNWDIYLMDADGKNVVQVTRSPMHELHPSFSRDGSRLVFCALGARSSQWELWIVDLTNLTTRVIGNGFFPTWSPTDERIAFQRARQRGSRWFSLWTLDLVDGEARDVTEVAVSSNAAIVAPAWSPDGKRLAFATIIEPGRGNRTRAEQDIWTINHDGTNRKRLTDGQGTNLSPAWSTDGKVYFISNRSGSECVWSGPAEASEHAVAKHTEAAPTREDVARQPSHESKESIGATDLHE